MMKIIGTYILVELSLVDCWNVFVSEKLDYSLKANSVTTMIVLSELIVRKSFDVLCSFCLLDTGFIQFLL
jgi:hypothetical protein